MKYATLIFTSCLSCLFQQGTVPKEKRNALLKEWRSASASGDYEKISLLLKEVRSISTETRWKAQIDQALESLAA